MSNTGIILTLAYPETIVKTSQEWYSPYLRFIGIGKKNYVRAGHAALVLIDKKTGTLDYYDFGRYVTQLAYGRVRSKQFDRELDFPLKAIIKNHEIVNLNELLHFLANHPELTHGEGKMIASVCNEIDYKAARNYINYYARQGFVKYAAFKKEGSNCARFVTDVLISSTTNNRLKKKLKKSTWFTPSTIGNVTISGKNGEIYEVANNTICLFNSTSRKITLTCFLDRLKNHQPNQKGTLSPKYVSNVSENAQWLSGIGSGAWFDIEQLPTQAYCYRIRRVSPNGHVDVDGIFKVHNPLFDLQQPYQFIHNSNCAFVTILQNEQVFYFSFQEDYSVALS